MSPRTTGILLLVAGALAAFVYLYEVKGGEQRAEAEAESKELFPGIGQDAITALVLTTKEGDSARLERRDGRWLLVTPVEFPADAFSADGIASSLVGLASEALLEDPQPPTEYGLGDGARVVRFTAGDAEHALRLGRKTPLGSNSYASVEGSDQIVTIATYKAESFDKSLLDLRERKILDFDTQAIERVEVRWPEGGVTLARTAPADADAAADGEAEGDAGAEAENAGGDDAADAERGWQVVAPIEGRADDETVNGLLSDLSFLRADGFVDAPSQEQIAGFEKPSFEVVLHGATGDAGEAPSWRMALGPVHEGDKRLVRGAHASLYTIAADRAADFPRQVAAYRFKQLAKFAESDAAQVDLFFSPEKGDPVAISASRGDEGWSSAPEPMAPDTISRMVSELANLEAGDIVSENASEEELAKLGLAPPRTILTVFGEAPEAAPDAETEVADAAAEPASPPRLAEIHLGNVEGSEWIIARAAGEPRVYRLAYELAEHVPIGLDAFRNRFVATEEPAADAPAAPGEAAPEFLPPGEESP